MVLDENPVKTQKLSNLAYNKKNARILVSDITIPCPSYWFLSYIIDELKKAAVKNITVLFGLSIHRKHTLDEKIKSVGSYTSENAKHLLLQLKGLLKLLHWGEFIHDKDNLRFIDI